MKFEIIFKILAVALLVVAAVFFWQQYSDAVFPCVVLAACAFFISMRFEIKARMKAREAAGRATEEEESPE